MTLTVDRPGRRTSPANNNGNKTAAAQRLRANFAAVKVAFVWFGLRRSLSVEQKAQAAEQFGAEGAYLTASKKLLETKHEAFQQVTAIRSQIISYWRSRSLPYPDPGVRLIRQDDVQAFNTRMTEYRNELRTAVDNLDQHFEQLKRAARDRLGSLYCESDYPSTLRGLFSVDFEYVATEPPEWLLRLNPDLYRQERERISARFDDAVKLAEEAFVAEFSRLITHLSERLTAGPDGERKVFRDSALGNLTAFFARFRNLNVRSNADLERLVETAQQVLAGADPHIVRNSESLRQHITSQLAGVQAHLDGLLVDQPRRRILRPGVATGRNGEVTT